MPEVITGWDMCSTLQNNVEQIAVSDSGMYALLTFFSSIHYICIQYVRSPACASINALFKFIYTSYQRTRRTNPWPQTHPTPRRNLLRER